MIAYLLQLDDSLLFSCMVSTIQLGDVVNLESALARKEHRMRFSNVARNLMANSKISLSSYNVRFMLNRNACFGEVEYGPFAKEADVILSSEILGSTKCITFQPYKIISDSELRAIARGAPQLTALCIHDARNLTANALNVVAHCCPMLESLTLFEMTAASREGTEVVCRQCTSLRVLKLCASASNPVPDIENALGNVVAQCCHNLETLEAYFDDEAVIEIVRNCPRLANVSLKSPGLTDSAIYALVEHRPGIKTLALSTLSMSTECLIHAANHFTALTDLYLMAIEMSEATLHAFGSTCGHQLQKLALPITPDGCDVRAILQYCHNLTVVDFTFAFRIRDEAIVLLAQQNHSLQMLYIGRCSELTEAIVYALADNCPQLRCINGDPKKRLAPAATLYLAERCLALQKLSAWWVDANDRVLYAIAVRCPKLRVLHLRGVSLSNSALATLATSCPHLETLTFERGDRNWADKGLMKALSNSCRKLTTLHIGCCTEGAKDAIEALARDRQERLGMQTDMKYRCAL